MYLNIYSNFYARAPNKYQDTTLRKNNLDLHTFFFVTEPALFFGFACYVNKIWHIKIIIVNYLPPPQNCFAL